MNNEKLKILQQVKDGTIEISEGLDLLNSLDKAKINRQNTSWQTGDRIVRVKVQSQANGKVDTTLPINLIKTASRFGALSASFIPYEVRKALDRNGFDLSSSGIKDLITMIDEGAVSGKIVDIDVNHPTSGQTHIEVFVD